MADSQATNSPQGGTWEPAPEDIEKILRGGEAEIRKLVDYLTPIIQFRVAQILLRFRLGERNLAQEVEDLSQEVFMNLFGNNAKVLRGWDPRRGMTLKSFAGLVAQRRVYSVMRSARRSPWTEDPRPPQEMETSTAEAGPERSLESRDRLQSLLTRLNEELSPLGQKMFNLLFMRERSLEEIGRETGLSADAIYAWRSRLRRLAVRLRQELDLEVP